MLLWLVNLGFGGSPATATADKSVGYISLISNLGASVTSTIDSSGLSANSKIEQILPLVVLLNQLGISAESDIDDTGESLDGTL